jgi:hypothetical protein
MPYQVGDIVEVLDEFHGHDFAIGERVRITFGPIWDEEDEENSYEAINDCGHFYNVFDCELSLVESAQPVRPKIKGFAKWTKEKGL